MDTNSHFEEADKKRRVHGDNLKTTIPITDFDTSKINGELEYFN
jgi:hypothetical protein